MDGSESRKRSQEVEMKLKVYRRDGRATRRSVTLDEQVFGIAPNEHAIWLDVRAIQAAGRQGTHKAKERGDVRGGGAKPWRQKGTGRARVGTIRSPLWTGGGTTFGPRPRNYRMGVNRKTKRLARRSVLSHRAAEDAIRVVEDFSLEAPRTREIADMLAALELADKKVLVVTGSPDKTLYLSGRNLKRVHVRDAASASTLDLVNAEILVFQESAIERVHDLLGGSASGKVAVDEPAEESPEETQEAA
jgi:large subunit ribosomal protein L4